MSSDSIAVFHEGVGAECGPRAASCPPLIYGLIYIDSNGARDKSLSVIWFTETSREGQLDSSKQITQNS